MVFLPTPSPTARQSAGAAGTFSAFSPGARAAVQWQLLGWPTQTAWEIAGRPNTSYDTWVAQAQSGAEQAPYLGTSPTTDFSDGALRSEGTLREELLVARQGASVSPVQPLTDFGESAVQAARGPLLDISEQAGSLAGQAIPFAAGPVPGLLSGVAEHTGLVDLPFDDIGGAVARTTADILLPANLKETALEVTPFGVAGDINDIRRLGEGALDTVGRSIYEALEDPNVLRGVTAPDVARVAGGGEPDALTDIVNAINDASRQADELRPIQDEMFREQRGQQFGRMEDALSENLGTGFDAFRAAREAGVGRFERPQIDIPTFSYDDLRLAFDEINMFPDMHPGQKIRASEALESLLINREPPEPYAFNQLRTVFPNTADEILEAVRNQYGLQPNLFDEGATTFPEGIPSETPYSDAMIRNIGEARANLGRATTRPERTFFEGFLNTLRDIPNELRQLVAGMDFSNALRQGLFTIRHTPSFMSDLYIGGRAMVDEKFALGYQALLKSRDRHGLFLSDLPGEPGFKNVSEAMARREENYSGQVVSKVLPYKMTGRGNTLFLNARRAHVYDLTEQAWDRPSWLNNVLARPGDKEALANYVNRTTGRGTLGPLENTWVESVLGFGLFSPKYLASRPQAFFNLFNFAHPRVQVEAIKDFTATFGATAALLGLANESSLAEVELDPTSSDFGKFRAGPIRVDPWAGFQQLATAAARVYSGASDPEEILPVLERFLRSKLAPFPGTAYSFLMKDGRDIIGRQIGIKELATSFLPIFIQSLYEGAQEGLMGEALSTLPAEFFGLGSQVYNRPEDLINQALLTEYPELTDREGRPISTFEEFRQNYPDLADQFRNQHMNLFEEKVETASAKVREDFALIQEYKTAQEARDQNFAVDPARWRSESQAQARALGVLRHNLWKDADFREENRGPLDEYRDMYHEQIEAATDPETKIIDWDKVDEWLAAQDAETQQFIFESGLEHETDLRKQYLRDVRELVPYWNMRDKAWRELTKDSETYSQYKTMDEAIQARAYQFVQEGADWTSARNLAEKQLDSITEAATNESYQYLDEHRELIPLLNKYDYYIPAFFRKFVQQ